MTDPCIAKAKPGEPMFTLLGRDPFAADLVWLWAQAREAYQAKAAPASKIADARGIAYGMQRWCFGLTGREPARLLDHLPLNALVAAIERRGYQVGLHAEALPGQDLRHAIGMKPADLPPHGVDPVLDRSRMADVMQRQGSSLKPADGAAPDWTPQTR